METQKMIDETREMGEKFQKSWDKLKEKKS